MENNNSVNLSFFNLAKDGDTAIVRLMHSSTDKIERKAVHFTKFGGKTRVIKCLSNNECPCCLRANGPLEAAVDRVFIHLFDYADNQEKIWNRTPTIIPQLQEIQNAWGNLSDCVLKITRVGNEYPKYNIVPLNPMNYAKVDQSRIDVNVAYRCFTTRSKEELEQFYSTGVMPEHKKSEFVPKEQYVQQINNDNVMSNQQNFNTQDSTFSNQNFTTTGNQFNQFAQNDSVSTPFAETVQNNYSNPFANSDPFSSFTLKKV